MNWNQTVGLQGLSAPPWETAALLLLWLSQRFNEATLRLATNIWKLELVLTLIARLVRVLSCFCRQAFLMRLYLKLI